jgi:hypothetical protein
VIPETNGQGAGPLAEQLMEQAKLLSSLRRDLDELANVATDSTADLLARMEELEHVGAGSRSSTAWCWRNIGPQAEEVLWKELDSWVAWIRSRYPLARKVPECWAKHPEVVEELSALWLAWQGAYEERDAPLTAAADWHDRWLPGVLRRLEHGVFSLDCSNEHRARPEAAYARVPASVTEQERHS